MMLGLGFKHGHVIQSRINPYSIFSGDAAATEVLDEIVNLQLVTVLEWIIGHVSAGSNGDTAVGCWRVYSLILELALKCIIHKYIYIYIHTCIHIYIHTLYIPF